MKVEWPDAKTFGATAKYLPHAIRDLERMEHQKEHEKREQEAEVAERQRIAQEAKDRTAWKALWDSLPAIEQENIRQEVLKHQPPRLAKFPALIERFCLEELARRRPGTT